jgi:superfamily I DNA/RNA helicase
MQRGLFVADSGAREGVRPGGSVGQGRLVVFGARLRAEQELRRRAGEAGAWADAVMIQDELFDGLWQGALRHAAATRLDVWFRGRRMASTVELELLARRVLQDFYAKEGGIFGKVARRSGFVEALLRFFEECREGLASEHILEDFAAALVAQGESADGLRVARLRELTRLFGRYERALAQLGWLDPGLGLRVALEALKDRRFPLPTPLQKLKQVELRDMYDWSPARIDVLRELAARLAREAGTGRYGEDKVVLHLPYDQDRPDLFHYLEPILRQIESLEGEALNLSWDGGGGLEDEEPAGRAAPLEELARAVWSEAGGVRSRLRGQEGERIEGLGPPCLTVLEAPGERREARAVARRVRRLLRGGAREEDIVVVVREVDEGVEVLGRALDEVRVPWQCARGAALREAPLARWVLSLLHLALEGCPREPFIEALHSRYLASWARGQRWDAHDLARLLREAGLRDDQGGEEGHRSAYEDLLDRTLAQLRRRLEGERARRARLGALLPEDNAPLDAHPELERVREMRERVVSLRRALARAFPRRRRRLSEHARALRALLEELKVARGALDPRKLSAGEVLGPLDARLLGALARDRQALALLERLLWELERSDQAALELQDAAPREEVALPPNLLSRASPPTRVSGPIPVPASVMLERQRAAFEVATLGEFLSSAGFGEVESLEEVEGSAWGAALSPAEFAELLDHLLSTLTLPARGVQGGAVRIVGAAEVAGCRFPHVLVAGLNHGRFPRLWRSRALFPDEDRLDFGRFEAALARLHGLERHRMSFPLQCLPYAAGSEDNPVPARQSEELLLFYFALSSATESLTLSCTTQDEAGRMSMRSVLLDEVLHRVPPRLLHEVLEREALDPVPDVAQCEAPWALLARFALSAVGDGVNPKPPPPGVEALRRALSERVEGFEEVERAREVERLRHRLSGLDPAALQALPKEHPALRYAGFLGGAHAPWLARALAFDAQRPLGATMLDRYGACPMRFWLHDLMHLRARHESSQDVSRQERGQLVQHLMQAAFEALTQAGIHALGQADEATWRRAARIVQDAVQEALRHWEDTRARAHPRLWERVAAFCEELLQHFLDRERIVAGQATLAAPWSFGFPWQERARDVGAVEVELAPKESVFVAGRVDRLVQAAGLSGGARVEIVEYGTARAESYEKRLSDARLLQTEHELPLAMLAVAQGLVPKLQAGGEVSGPVLLMASYESLSEGRRSPPLIAEAAPPADGGLLAQTQARMVEVVRGMRGGWYPFATQDCAFCRFRAVCRRGNYPEAP